MSSGDQLSRIPYDIRYMIYSLLFPDEDQVYLQAQGKDLHCILPGGGIPVNLFLVNRQLSTEARAYLYNSYLFNLVGPRADCLRTFSRFTKYVETHARAPVSVDAFGNGAHSSTMCISIQAGTAKMSVLKRRRRGEWQDIKKLHREFIARRWWVGSATLDLLKRYREIILVGALAVILAVLAGGSPDLSGISFLTG